MTKPVFTTGALGLAGVLLLQYPHWLSITIGTLALLCGGLVFFSRNDRETMWRWDHFLPFLTKRWLRSKPTTLPVRIFTRLLPKSFFFDPDTGREGVIRRRLRKMGPSVLAAPWRRLIQGLCFCLFLFLFFYACWPYGARPDEPARASENWRFDGLDQSKGAVRFREGAPATWMKPGTQTYVGQGDSNTRTTILSVEGSAITVQPESVRPFLVSDGLWTLWDKEPKNWPSHYTDHFASREKIPADVFLAIDPLVSLSTAIASRQWVWSLVCAAVILLVCVLIPRGFCGYLCPLGTLIDMFDWAASKRVKRFRVPGDGWWVHIKYYLLAFTLIAAVGGLLVSGFVSAVPVITRGFLFLLEPLQSGLFRGWHLVPSYNAAQWLSIALFVGVFLLGLLKPRFWCRYVCPSGAVFSIGNLFRLSERKVESSCIHCNKCVNVCPFDAIKPDFTTRTTDCTLCQTCGGVCPTHSIKFVERWNRHDLKNVNDPPTRETALGRRGFVSWLVGGSTAMGAGALTTWSTRSFEKGIVDPVLVHPVRPPGSVPEEEFLQMCIRCGECYKVCPNNVLQPMGFERGLQTLWTPKVQADWAGCDSSCNACGQVCPTGAIRALPLEEKKNARMGLAVVTEDTCLPYANREACQLCVDECIAAGYDAIEFTRVHTAVDDQGDPVEESGFVAPVVLPDKCVGCGLCQTRCHGINVEAKGLLRKSAIIIEAGEGKEDRKHTGSYKKESKPNNDLPVAESDSDPFAQ